MYISEGGNQRVRKVETTGIITTFVGSGSVEYAGEGVAATSAGLFVPTGMAIDAANGDFYISVYLLNRILVVTGSTNLASTFAGTGSAAYDGENGAATSASLQCPDGNFLDQSTAQLYIVDSCNHRGRVIFSTGPTIAPTLSPTFSMAPSFSSAPTSASPTASPSRARSSVYYISTVAGNGNEGSSGSDGPALSASLNGPRSVWMDSVGVMYIVEVNSNCIRTVDTSEIVHDFAGVCGSSGASVDGVPATSALMNFAVSLFVASTGVVYVGDYYNYKVRSFSSGVMTTFAGTGSPSDSGDGGLATSADVNGPHGIWGDSTGVVYIGLHASSKVRMISTSNIITTIAG